MKVDKDLSLERWTAVMRMKLSSSRWSSNGLALENGNCCTQ
jgi:hypothetical protein